jgi:hypothetical protein
VPQHGLGCLDVDALRDQSGRVRSAQIVKAQALIALAARHRVPTIRPTPAAIAAGYQLRRTQFE